MTPSRTRTINGRKVNEYYWAGDYPVYVDNRLQPGETFAQVCARLEAEAPK